MARPPAENPSDGFGSGATAATLHAVQLCWAKGVFIGRLTHRFWKLTLQVWLARDNPGRGRSLLWISVRILQLTPHTSMVSC